MSRIYEPIEIIEIVETQVIDIFKNWEWNIITFDFSKTAEGDIIITRKTDNKQLLIPIHTIKKKCIIECCKKWLCKLKSMLAKTFGKNNSNCCTLLTQKVNEISTQTTQTLELAARMPTIEQTTTQTLELAARMPTIEEQTSAIPRIEEQTNLLSEISDKIDCMYGEICGVGLADDWIVSFQDDFDGEKYSWPDYVTIKHIYKKAYHGMCINSTVENVEKLKLEVSGVKSYFLAGTVRIAALNQRSIMNRSPTPQMVDPYIVRIGANHSSQKSGDKLNSLTERPDINVFVLDTGIALHPELNLKGGINFTNGPATAWEDVNGHGTHVAGIIGALDNNIGHVGIAPGVRLWSVKVLNNSGSGNVGNIIAGIDWILSNRGKLWNGYGILNMSFGGSANSALDDAINKAIAAALIPVIAAGNESSDASNFSPARVENAITVGSTGPNPSYNSLSSFSNFGPDVDILAPGERIASTYTKRGYAILSGTSMATPVVTGTIVLLLTTRAISGIGVEFVNNVKNELVTASELTNPINFDGTTGVNPKVDALGKNVTNTNVWTGSF
ncbi:peptidase inhibitor I9 [Tupanvirus deep ocean]|uniref:Peptidase inhibitor I9 n=2 Tax=Tupanvirus TaxID=2094720 RepID=A0AC62A983_9VIRU|nr:peptidase inhibitor I9 [Tupanvirus deep ocean]QKU34200.1 peptidase inhibitor I9 [Tupanvirus deep ocean]